MDFFWIWQDPLPLYFQKNIFSAKETLLWLDPSPFFERNKIKERPLILQKKIKIFQKNLIVKKNFMSLSCHVFVMSLRGVGRWVGRWVGR